MTIDRLARAKEACAPFHVGSWQHLANDANGDTGTVLTDILQFSPDPLISSDLEAPEGVSFLKLLESYREWPKHQTLESITDGYIASAPTDDVRLRTYQADDGRELHLVVLRQQAWHQGSTGYGQLIWAKGGRLSTFSLHDFSPSIHRFNDLRPAWDAISTVANIQPGSRGRRPGDGAYHHTAAAFLAELDEAIRHVQSSTLRAKPDARLVMRRLNYEKSAFCKRVKDATGKRWRDVEAEYELRGIQRN